MKSGENCQQNIVWVRIPDCGIEENDSLRNSLSTTEESAGKEHFRQVEREKTDRSSRLNFPHFDL